MTEELQKRDLADVPTPKLYDIMIKLHARVEGACPALTLRDDDEIADQKALRGLVASRRIQKVSAKDAHAGRQGNGDGTVRADDLVTLQLTTLQRFRAGEIDEHAAMTEIALVNSLLKGMGLTSVQEELQHIKDLLQASSGGVIAMWDSYRRDLRRAVRASPGREKGPLYVAYPDHPITTSSASAIVSSTKILASGKAVR